MTQSIRATCAHQPRDGRHQKQQEKRAANRGDHAGRAVRLSHEAKLVGIISPASLAEIARTRHRTGTAFLFPTEFRPLAEPALVIDQVRKSFSGHVAVKNLSLQVPRGSVYGLLGPNGAGKTTTIRMLLDIILPDSGSISIFGRSNRDTGLLDKI